MNEELTKDYNVLPYYTRAKERARFLADIITTAVEGGVNYWASVQGYRWWDPDLDGGTALHRGDQANAYAVLVDEAGEDPTPRLVMVEHISRALGVLREGPVEGLSDDRRADIVAQDRANGEDDNHQDIDADLADCIVQVALFGKVLYG